MLSVCSFLIPFIVKLRYDLFPLKHVVYIPMAGLPVCKPYILEGLMKIASARFKADVRNDRRKKKWSITRHGDIKLNMLNLVKEAFSLFNH